MKIIYPFSTSWQDYPSNDDLAIVIYTVGCEHNCIGCHNKELFNDNKNAIEVDCNSLYQLLLDESKKQRTNKIVFEGGDPLFRSNIETIREFLNINSYFDVCIYTGYSIDYIKKNNIKHFSYIKSGTFDINHTQKVIKTDEKMTLVSTNQNFYDSNLNCISKNGTLCFDRSENV